MSKQSLVALTCGLMLANGYDNANETAPTQLACFDDMISLQIDVPVDDDAQVDARIALAHAEPPVQELKPAERDDIYELSEDNRVASSSYIHVQIQHDELPSQREYLAIDDIYSGTPSGHTGADIDANGQDILNQSHIG